MRRLFLSLAVLLIFSGLSAQVRLSSLRTNYLYSATGVVTPSPTFSWILESSERNVLQTAYQVRVLSEGRLIWDSGKISSDVSTGVPYLGPKLASGTRYDWQVRIWDGKGKATSWARTGFLTGLMDMGQLRAEWIEPETLGAENPLLRKDFSVSGNLKSAVLYITSYGNYEARINGQKVSEDRLTPGWTTYEKRLQYQTYDVTSLLLRGANAIGVEIGRGWYLSNLGFTSGHHQIYSHDRLSLLAQMVLTYRDGRQELVTTDASWRSATGAVTFTEFYNGETVDLGLYPHGWDRPGYDDASWKPVRTANYPKDILVTSESVPVRIQQYVNPVAVLTTPKGEKVLDFGQNLVGSEVVRIHGRKGQKLVIDHAEVLDEDGNFYTVNLRSAKARSTYVCSGGDDEFQTRFTYYGFRYLRVEGWDGPLDPGAFRAAVLFSDMEQTGTFTSSNAQVNQLQSNIEWGLRGNFIDVPTDCPQRDERLGWTGDAEVFSRTAMFNRDVHAFFMKWMKDLAADQMESGAVTDIVPFIPGLVGSGHTGWGDAAVIIPWNHYMAYGDRRMLSDQFDSMCRWADFIDAQTVDDLWNTGWQYGDWLFYSVDNDTSGNSAVTFKPLIMQCFFANAATIVASAARVLGREKEQQKYEAMAKRAKDAFVRNYLTGGSYLVSATQTAYVLALNFDMIPEAQRPAAAALLAKDVRERGHITTGFLGTPYICHVLTRFGYTDLAYQLLLRQEYPGWLYPVTMGATTIWERWNSMMPDRTIPDNGMNSFNHYSYGAIGDWLYRDAAGLFETSPGFKTLAVKPHIGGGFTFMKVTQKTPYGQAGAAWQLRDGKVEMTVTVPANATGEVFVPCPKDAQVLVDGRKPEASGLSLGAWEDGYRSVRVGSGTYRFEAAQ